jgi:hypothetical protein
MVSSRYSGPERRNNLKSSTKIATRVLLISMLALVAFCLLTVPTRPVHASSGGSLSLGSIALATPIACQGGQWLPSMHCFAAGLAGCANVDNLGFTYGYLIPSGTVNGVVVFFDGGDGTTAAFEEEEYDMLEYYAGHNYGVVEIQWSSAWEQTSSANIQNAACRPATFLNYVYNNIYLPIATGSGGNPNAGMCAQGFSAGSTAITYSLAYYGAGNQLDNVELISGPVLSDIKQGCVVPQAASVTVCPSGQYGCRLGTDMPWMLPPAYVKHDTNYVRAWTSDSTCNGSTQTSGASNAAWLAQSVVDQSSVTGLGATPTFTYPSTAMNGWLCRTLQNLGSDCATNPDDYLHCPNNSSPQGQIFYSQITSANSPYNVYSVDGCYGPEGAPQGTVAGITGNPGALAAIEQNMTAHCVHPAH